MILTQVIPHSPAALAGLKPLDRLRTIDKHSATSDQISKAAMSLPVTVTIERDGVITTKSINPISAAIVAAKPTVE